MCLRLPASSLICLFFLQLIGYSDSLAVFPLVWCSSALLVVFFALARPLPFICSLPVCACPRGYQRTCSCFLLRACACAHMLWYADRRRRRPWRDGLPPRWRRCSCSCKMLQRAAPPTTNSNRRLQVGRYRVCAPHCECEPEHPPSFPLPPLPSSPFHNIMFLFLI